MGGVALIPANLPISKDGADDRREYLCMGLKVLKLEHVLYLAIRIVCVFIFLF